MSMRWLKNFLLVIVFLAAVRYWLNTKSYIFEEKSIVKLVQRYGGDNLQASIARITDELERGYPNLVLPKERLQWVMLKFSGMTISLTVLYASLTEYVVIAGSALDTDGYLGRHWSNMTHIVLSGSIKYWREGTSEAKVYHKGESFTTRYWNTGGMQLKANTWMIEYGRGFLPLSIPSTIFDGIFTSFDLIGTFKMMRVFGMAYFYGIKNEIASFIKSI
ncbi:sigma non-opioid intracellular receptor 1-like isoform X2 [Xenia sp. Carnegie-2017]|uniref:sigma non-opioid intracellular receptor 1-like isoform X2 n=1 Tax=Xenia sp. Carnegie-2017 TaxID=2897299 RepID=UPI001F050118|nr:sigma non-opioid intracellular receptor 1-like isoform X2 [Xenia sp. Carnegie-2017]